MTASLRTLYDSLMARTVILVFAICVGYLRAAPAKQISLDVMAPLAIGDVRDPDGPGQKPHWEAFERQLEKGASLGARAVTTDVWWGVVEPSEGTYNWRYYDKLATTIHRAGLKWIPILSFHQCGGNVGDDCYFPLPLWIWKKYVDSGAIPHADHLRYRSVFGNVSSEVVSVWGTPLVLSDYRRFMKEFQSHFSNRSSEIAEINVSLGASGELRFPSYNAHDPRAGYPGRGAFQAYSVPALEGFRKFLAKRYSTLTALNTAWGTKLGSWSDVSPPTDGGPQDGSGPFFSGNHHFAAYGKDFFDFYQTSLLDHGEAVMTAAAEVFNASSAPFKGIGLGAKMPGVHWRSGSDRLAELAAGMLRTSDGGWNSDSLGRGYRPILDLFRRLSLASGSPKIVLHFTCLEKDNGEDGAWANSMAKALVFWVGAEAKRQQITIKGENALAGPLAQDRAWDNMIDALHWSSYVGVTFLRLHSVVDNGLATRRFKGLFQEFDIRP